jgi:hypothetical protein
MTSYSPTLAGFRVMFRRPSLGLAEIAWRWSVGLATALLLFFSFVEYLDTLPVTAADLFLLRSRRPVLISRAIVHIFSGSAPRLVAASMLLIFAMALAWIGTAALGRAATLRALGDYFLQINAADKVEPTRASLVGRKATGRLRSLIGLNFCRAGITLAAVVACVGGLLLAGFVSSKADPSPGSATLIFLSVAMLVWLAWAVLNWFLSISAIFVVAEGHSTFGALAAAVDFCRARTGSLLAAGTWFEIAHVVVFVVASSVIAIPLAFSGVLPAGVILGGMLLVALLYFAVVDFLYIGRLAAYVAIIRFPEPTVAPQDLKSSLPGGRVQYALASQPRSGVDPDELILSDV